MTEKELRALDAWIAETIFWWHKVKTGDNKSLCSVCGNGFGPQHKHYVPEFHSVMTGNVPHYTTDAAAAMQVLEKCINYDAYATGSAIRSAKGESLPLHICLFAKQLFSK